MDGYFMAFDTLGQEVYFSELGEAQAQARLTAAVLGSPADVYSIWTVGTFEPSGHGVSEAEQEVE